MPSATTKTLRILVEASGAAAAARQIAAVDKQVQALGRNKTVSKLGAGVGNVVRNSLVLGTVAAGAVAGYMAIAIRDGQEATRVQQIYDTAVANSSKSASTLTSTLKGLNALQAKAKPGSKQYDALAASIAIVKTQMANVGPVTQTQNVALEKQRTELMNLAGVDDELIQTEQTRLIQMGLNGAAVAKLTPLIMDMSKATGRDLLSSTLAVGKATQGNTAGLQRFGVFVDKAKAKVDPFGAVIDALNKKFGGTTQALSGNFDTRMGALRANLDNISESVGQKMLPALTRIVDVIGTKVVPAFGKFIDRVMPSITSAINQFATMLETGGAEKAIDAIYTSMSALVDLLRIAAEPVKMIVGAFMSLPKEVQTVLVAGFAVNKLSGGMFGSVAGDLLKGGLKGIVGITAATAEVKAGVVNVTGGIPGAGGGGGGLPSPVAAAAGGGALAGAATLGAGVAGILGAYALPAFRAQFNPEARALSTSAGTLKQTGTTSADFFSGLMPGFNAMARNAGATPIARVPTGASSNAVLNALPTRIERAVAMGMKTLPVNIRVSTAVSIRTVEAARNSHVVGSGSNRVRVYGGLGGAQERG